MAMSSFSLVFSLLIILFPASSSHQPNSHIQSDQEACTTGNPIDDCWRCDPDWDTNRKMLANCAVGFGRNAIGGQYGEIYVVNDSSDDPMIPRPGTLRYGSIQDEPLWIIFGRDMKIQLNAELIVSSSYNNGMVRDSPQHYQQRSISDGDGISIKGSKDVWIDHCTMANCRDGLIDVVLESTGITISNNYMFEHDEVMLMGHSDDYTADKNMQVTIAFNFFGEGLVQRMPRCRHGYFHIVNNIYNGWKMYAIGGSANPTINSQGNIFIATNDTQLKEVTKRERSTGYGAWEDWNWRSDGDLMYNGAYFTPSGKGSSGSYAKASSMIARPAPVLVTRTISAGVLECIVGRIC